MVMEALQKQLQDTLASFKSNQKESSRLISNRQRLDAQLSENKIVLEELKLLEPGADVYKLIGPVLVKQDLEESRMNVQKRIDYISKELKRHDDSIEKLQQQQEVMKEALGKLQGTLMQTQARAQALAAGEVK